MVESILLHVSEKWCLIEYERNELPVIGSLRLLKEFWDRHKGKERMAKGSFDVQ